MTVPKPLSDTVVVSGQITADDVEAAAAQGFTTIVNNRPDGEEPGQPTSAEIEGAARAAGLAYVHAPVSGFPGPEAVDAVATVLVQEGRAWMFCRSGMRSTVTWALAMRRAGADPDDLRDAAAQAGYDLSRLPL